MEVKSHINDSKSSANKNNFTCKKLKTKIQQYKDWSQVA
jgi:hypothetical protein